MAGIRVLTAAAMVAATAVGVSLATGAPPVAPAQSFGAAMEAPREDDVGARAVLAVRDRLRAAAEGPAASLRAYRIEGRNEVAVCGSVAGSGGAVEVVARVVMDSAQVTQDRRSPPLVVLEDGPGLARSNGLARERYCHDEPPVVAVAAPQAEVAAAAAPPTRRVVVVSAVNVRASPGGGGQVLRAAPRGASFVVVGEAPGGWLQIGDGATVLGWAHSSLLAPAPI